MTENCQTEISGAFAFLHPSEYVDGRDQLDDFLKASFS